jgi:outer membrane immunogenic protein
MKKLLFASVAGVALVAGAPAHAADLRTRPTYDPPPPVVAPVPIFTWTGCYIGGHVGGGWGRKTFSDNPDSAEFAVASGGSTPESITNDVSGFLGGGQVGCNYQFSPNWLVGVEGSFSGADINGDVVDPFNTGKTFHAKTDWLASVTGRVGWTWNRWMVYGKGGIAWAHDHFSANDVSDNFSLLPVTETRTGWTVGAGIEWAFLPNWSAFVEYDFYDFGTRTEAFAWSPSSTNPTIDIKQQVQTAKIGINYLFNWGKAPVVARY